MRSFCTGALAHWRCRSCHRRRRCRLPGAAPFRAWSPAKRASPAGASRSHRTLANMEEQASAGGCAYCAEPLDPFQRCYCATCCPGAGAVAPWFSCRSCAAQRNEAGGDAAGQHVVKWRRVEQAGAGTPCFEAGHCLVQVVPPGSGWLTLQPGPEQGESHAWACPNRKPAVCSMKPANSFPRAHCPPQLPSPNLPCRRQVTAPAPIPARVPREQGAAGRGVDSSAQQRGPGGGRVGRSGEWDRERARCHSRLCVLGKCRWRHAAG